MANTPTRAGFNADESYFGSVYYDRYSPDGRAGVKTDMLKVIDLGVPVTADSDAIMDGATVYTNSAVVLTAGALALTVLDVPRNVQVVSTNITTLTQVVRVTGTDVYGETMVEDITANGTTAVTGLKAFKGVTRIDIPAGAAAGTLDIGFGDKLGLPFRISSAITGVPGGLRVDNIVNTTAVFVTGLATTVTSTAGSGDVRGTVTSTGSLPNNARRYTLFLSIPEPTGKDAVFGVDQFAG